MQKVEQRISANQIVSPEGDSAVDAWQQVLEMMPATDPVRLEHALANFAVQLRRHASEEKRAGNTTISAGLSVFASQAEELQTQRAPSADADIPPPAVQAENSPPTLAPRAEVSSDRPGARAGTALASRLNEFPQPHPDLRPHPGGAPRRTVHVVTEVPRPQALEASRPDANGVIPRLLY